MATIVLQVPDETLVSKVKQVCKMLMGVTSVKILKDAKPKEYDITKKVILHSCCGLEAVLFIVASTYAYLMGNGWTLR